MLERLIRVFEIACPDVPLGEVAEHTSLAADLGINSISMLLMAIAVEEEFGIVFGTVRADELRTVGAVMAFIGRRLSEQ